MATLGDNISAFAQKFFPVTQSKTTEKDLLKMPTIQEMKLMLGVARDVYTDAYVRSEARSDDLPKEEYRKMMQNDGQVKAITSLPRFMLLGAGFTITGEDMDEELSFIERNLTKSANQGGMDKSLYSVIEDMTLAPFEGARFYELVFTADSEKGLIKVKKIAPRDNITCYPLVDDNGDYAGFVQRVSLLGATRTVTIPKYKSTSIIFNEAYGGLHGLSELKSAWYHYDKKHKLIFISHLAAETQTIPPKVINNKGMDQATKNAVEAAVDNLGLQSRVTIPAELAEIVQLQGNGQTNVNILDLIKFHDSQISKSMLAQFIDLGSVSSDSGSRALGGSQIDLYLAWLQGLQIKIEDAINSVIAILIDMNFGTGKYPVFKFNPIRDDKKEMLYAVFKDFATKGRLKETTIKGIVERVSEDVGLDYEETEYDAEEVQTQTQPEMQQEIPLPEKNTELAEVDVMSQRLLYPDEERADFEKIRSRLDAIQLAIASALATWIGANETDILDAVTRSMRTGDFREILQLGTLSVSEVEAIFRNELIPFYEYIKVKAADEIDVTTPTTSTEQRNLLNIMIAQNAAKFIEDMRNAVVNITRDSLAKKGDAEMARQAVAEELNKFKGEKASLVADQNAVNVMNQSRMYVFNENNELITGYRYTAVLDSRTTEYCRSLDGKVFSVDDPRLATIWPPNHFRCRSTMTAIKATDTQPIFNRAPIGYGSLSEFKDKNAFLSDESTDIESEIDKEIARLVKEL